MIVACVCAVVVLIIAIIEHANMSASWFHTALITMVAVTYVSQIIGAIRGTNIRKNQLIPYNVVVLLTYSGSIVLFLNGIGVLLVSIVGGADIFGEYYEVFMLEGAWALLCAPGMMAFAYMQRILHGDIKQADSRTSYVREIAMLLLIFLLISLYIVSELCQSAKSISADGLTFVFDAIQVFYMIGKFLLLTAITALVVFVRQLIENKY